MQHLFKSGLLALTGLSIVAGSAIANPTKWTNSGREYVVFDNLNPGDQISINLDNQDLERRITANACGWLNLSTTTTYPTPSSIAVSSDGGVTFGATQTVGSTSQQFLRCSNGVVVDGAGNTVASPSSAFLDSTGKTVLPGYTQNARYVVKYVGSPATVSRKVNGCGFVQLTQNTDTLDMTGFSYNGTAYSLAGLTEQSPPRCTTINGETVRYEPQA